MAQLNCAVFLDVLNISIKGHLLTCLDIHGQEPRLLWLAVVVNVADKLGPGPRHCALTGHRARGEALLLVRDIYIIRRS